MLPGASAPPRCCRLRALDLRLQWALERICRTRWRTTVRQRELPVFGSRRYGLTINGGTAFEHSIDLSNHLEEDKKKP
jgi:hypothetical protein